jgi:hypothetical protein
MSPPHKCFLVTIFSTPVTKYLFYYLLFSMFMISFDTEGRPLYVMKPPQGNVLPQVFGSIMVSPTYNFFLNSVVPVPILRYTLMLVVFYSSLKAFFIPYRWFQSCQLSKLSFCKMWIFLSKSKICLFRAA